MLRATRNRIVVASILSVAATASLLAAALLLVIGTPFTQRYAGRLAIAGLVGEWLLLAAIGRSLRGRGLGNPATVATAVLFASASGVWIFGSLPVALIASWAAAALCLRPPRA